METEQKNIPVEAEAPASLDGPGRSIKIKAAAPVTARLSKNAKGIMAGGLVAITAAIIFGVATSGKDPSGAPGAGGTAAENPETAASTVGQQFAPLAAKQEAGSDAVALPPSPAVSTAAKDIALPPPGLYTREQSSVTASGAGAIAPPPGGMGQSQPSPAEQHKQWLEKHHYERLQGRILAVEAATQSDISKGSFTAPNAAKAMNVAFGGSPAAAGAGGYAQPPVVDLQAIKSQADKAVAESQKRRQTLLAQAEKAAQEGGAAGLGGGLGGLKGLIPGLEGQDDAAARAQAKNKEFVEGAQAKNDLYSEDRVQTRQGKHELIAGSVIPAVLVSSINSDLPGMITAQVRQTVYDTHNPGVVVIPQGSRLIGRYSSDVGYGQERVLAAWDSLIFPNGNSISLRGAMGADGMGQSGLNDKVDNHFWRIWGSALLTSALGAGVQLSQPQQTGSNTNPTPQQMAAGAFAESLNKTGEKLLSKNLGLQPTLSIRPGYAFNVMVNKTLVLPAYRVQVW